MRTLTPVAAIVSAKARFAGLAWIQPSLLPWVTSIRPSAPWSIAIVTMTRMGRRRPPETRLGDPGAEDGYRPAITAQGL
jgi:hypothetical protein